MLDLYMSEYCPYCQKVIKYLEDNDIEFVKKDVNSPENFEKLVMLGGKDQVPFLYDNENDTMLYESNDIIEYIKSVRE